jgi:uncharacterized repeat protein (TIGR03803 family)
MGSARAQTLTLVASFDFPGLLFPNGVVLDSKGDLFGTAAEGGENVLLEDASGYGGIFEVKAGSSAVTDLANFNVTDGAFPASNVVLDGNGDLFGTSSDFGSHFAVVGDGTVFELKAGSGTITNLANFDGTNGTDPAGTVVLDSHGDLFGTADSGGANGYGDIFELAAGSNTITDLADFDGADGADANGVVVDSQGDLFGTTEGGGSDGYGDVFELAAGSNTITDLANFDGQDGFGLDSSVALDSDGDVFGTASEFDGGAPGSAYGTVFEVKAGSGEITDLANFNGADGAVPDGDVFVDSAGDLFGTTNEGGADAGEPYEEYSSAAGSGALFEVKAGSGTITDLINFNDPAWSNPYGPLTFTGNGDVYGVTRGTLANDAVFEVSGLPVAAAPEPGALAVLVPIGMCGIVGLARRRTTRAKATD